MTVFNQNAQTRPAFIVPSMQAPKLIRLRTLGQFALEVDGATIRISSRKGCGLLAVLAMRSDYKESRKQLATLLWADHNDKQARQNLRQCLATLRTDLAPQAGDLLVFDGEMIGLDPELTSVDAREFLALAESSDAVDIERAASLYRGEFLAGLSLDIETFDEWVTAERTKIISSATGVFAAHAINCERLGDGRRAIEAAERLVALDPLREDSQRLLLTLYARYVGRDAALAHFKTLTLLLKRELDVGPDPSTVSLIEDIKQRAVAPQTPVVVAPSPPPLSDEGEGAIESGRSNGTDEQPVAAPKGAGQRLSARLWPMGLAGSVVAVVLALVWLSIGTGIGPESRNDRAHNGISSVNRGKVTRVPDRTAVTVAVLPFSAPAGGVDQTIADAIADDISTYLSRYTRLRVMSRQIALHYRDQPQDAGMAGAELGVRYVIDGVVRTEGDQARISVQLIDTATKLQTWSTLLEQNGIRRMDVLDEIAKRLAHELQVEAGISRPAPDRAIEDYTTADLIARGRTAQFRGANTEDSSEALGYFEEALRRDPNLVPALIGVTAALVTGSLHGVRDPAPSLSRARQLIDRAVRLNPDSMGAHHWSGIIYKANLEFDLALQSLRRSIDISPSFAPAYAQLASTLAYMGRFQEAKEHVETAIRLSPKDRTMGFTMLIKGKVELELGDDAAALESLRRAEAYLPRSPGVHQCLAAIYALMNDRVKSAKHVAAFHRYAHPAAAKQVMDRLRGNAKGEFSKTRRMSAGLKTAFDSSM